MTDNTTDNGAPVVVLVHATTKSRWTTLSRKASTRVAGSVAVLAFAVSLVACAGPMSTEDAAAKYLEIVCPNNKLIEEMDAAWDAGDLDAFREAARERARVSRAGAKTLKDDSIKWPEAVDPADLKTMADTYLADQPGLDTIANAETLEEANVRLSNSDEWVVATQNMRFALDLPAVGGCPGE